MDYNETLILSPMVRVGTQPMRMLAAGYGADIVYSEELVDKRVIASVRRVNEALGTVDFLDKGGEQGGRVMFRTCASERSRLVLQLGTADGTSALAAAQVMAADVAAVDVNMGCPKQFSLQGGMGAALLRKPELAEDILKTLRRNLQLPVSCKIRLLDDPRDTVELARRLAACGISALAVHGRTTQQRPRDPANWEPIRLVVDALSAQQVPVIANGDVMSYEDAQRVRQETGCAAAMIARAAMWNASVFRPQGFLPLDEVQREYVRLALTWQNALPNTKYCLKEMADAPVSYPGRDGGPRSLVGHDGNTAITRAKDEQQLCALLGLRSEPPYEDLPHGADAHVGRRDNGAPGVGGRGAAGGPRGVSMEQQQQQQKHQNKQKHQAASQANGNKQQKQKQGHQQGRPAGGGQAAGGPTACEGQQQKAQVVSEPEEAQPEAVMELNPPPPAVKGEEVVLSVGGLSQEAGAPQQHPQLAPKAEEPRQPQQETVPPSCHTASEEQAQAAEPMDSLAGARAGSGEGGSTAQEDGPARKRKREANEDGTGSAGEDGTDGPGR